MNGVVQQRSFVSLASTGGLLKSSRERPGSGDSRQSGGSGGGEGAGVGRMTTPTTSGLLLCSLYTSSTMGIGKENKRSESQLLSGRLLGPPSVNACVKRPFKHSIRTPSQSQTQEPAQSLLEMTAVATLTVGQMLTTEGQPLTRRRGGRLQKGRLKPLYPVSVSGPSIRQCRGILADTRSYSASASRTLQRRRHIVSQVKSGALSLEPRAAALSLPGDDDDDNDDDDDVCRLDSESVHLVSAASSVEDLTPVTLVGGGGGGEGGARTEEDFEAELAEIERDAAVLLQEILDKDSGSKEDGGGDRRESKSAGSGGPPPPSLEQDVNILENPDFSTPVLPPVGPHTPRPSQSPAQARVGSNQQPSSSSSSSPVTAEGLGNSPRKDAAAAARHLEKADSKGEKREHRSTTEHRTADNPGLVRQKNVEERQGDDNDDDDDERQRRENGDHTQKSDRQRGGEDEEQRGGNHANETQRKVDRGRKGNSPAAATTKQRLVATTNNDKQRGGGEGEEEENGHRLHKDHSKAEPREGKKESHGEKKGSRKSSPEHMTTGLLYKEENPPPRTVTTSAAARPKGGRSTTTTTSKDLTSDYSVPVTTHRSCKRPVSAGVSPSLTLLTSSAVKARPQTAAVSAKTVRFADQAQSSHGKRMPVGTRPKTQWLDGQQ